MRVFAIGIAAAFVAEAAVAEERTYEIDRSHSQIVFEVVHNSVIDYLGLISGFSGEIVFDDAAPENGRVEATIPMWSIIVGRENLERVILEEFFDAAAHPVATFKSTSIEVTGDRTGRITGDFTLNGVTKEIVLETTGWPVLEYPTTWQTGFSATTEILRSDFGADESVMPYRFVGNEIKLRIEIEAHAKKNAE